MNDNRTQKIVGLAAAAILLPILIGLLFGAAAAYYLPVVIVLLAGVLGYCLLQPQPRPKIDPWQSERRPPEPEKPRRPPPKDVDLRSTLPSSGTDYRFGVTGTVSWRPVGTATEHADPDSLARDAVLAWAAKITRQYALTERERAEQDLAADLGASKPDRGNEIEVWAGDLVLTVADEDDRRIRVIENVQKDWEVFDYQRNKEVDVRRYLTDDAFSTQGSTLVWWLSRNLHRFDDSMDRVDTFARISAIAQGRPDPVPDGRRSLASEVRIAGGSDAARLGGRPSGLLRRLLPSAADEDRGMLADRFARVADELGYPDVADTLRAEHGLQDVREPDADDDVSEPGGPAESGDEPSPDVGTADTGESDGDSGPPPDDDAGTPPS